MIYRQTGKPYFYKNLHGKSEASHFVEASQELL